MRLAMEAVVRRKFPQWAGHDRPDSREEVRLGSTGANFDSWYSKFENGCDIQTTCKHLEDHTRTFSDTYGQLKGGTFFWYVLRSKSAFFTQPTS